MASVVISSIKSDAKEEMALFKNYINKGLDQKSAANLALKDSLEELLSNGLIYKRKIDFKGITEEDAFDYINSVISKTNISPVVNDKQNFISSYLGIIYSKDTQEIIGKFSLEGKVIKNNPSYITLKFGLSFKDKKYLDKGEGLVEEHIKLFIKELGSAYVDPNQARSLDSPVFARDPNILICESCGGSVAGVDACPDCNWAVPKITFAGGVAGQSIVLDAIEKVRREMHGRFDTLDAKLDDISLKIPDKEMFLKRAYGAVNGGNVADIVKYVKSNEQLYSQISELTKQTGKIQTAMGLIVGRILEKELIYGVDIDGGTSDGNVYVVDKPFSADFTIQPSRQAVLERIESTLPINNAWYGVTTKPVLKTKSGNRTVTSAGINEILESGSKYTAKLEINNPEIELGLLLTAYANTEIDGENYPITIKTNTIDVKTGKVGLTRLKKGLKAAAQFIGGSAFDIIGLVVK